MVRIVELDVVPVGIPFRDLEANHGVAPAVTQSVTYYADDSSDFARKAEERLNDQFCARHGNLTSSRIAKVIADLEGAEAGMMFGCRCRSLSRQFSGDQRFRSHWLRLDMSK
ncbi:cystathionine beta-lyase/cystathionine gamma-synthase [Bradyrhizobium elkanii]|uniref:PLP-dependent transferase n=1 Tax=Bradyrhizobium elkanii TaxID=29448 RepID=UPI00038100A7|nr:PLP-dependent transferase [Bradyrhizobium elkanii]GEC57147.1 hypothetical protein BEL01nite_61900 [Bradyrhizobium elkanii]